MNRVYVIYRIEKNGERGAALLRTGCISIALRKHKRLGGELCRYRQTKEGELVSEKIIDNKPMRK